MKTRPMPGSLSEAITLYLNATFALGYSPHTITLKEHNLLEFKDWCLRESLPSFEEIRIDELERFLLYLRKLKISGGEKHLANSTIRLKMTGVKVFLRWLFVREYISHNDCEKFILPKVGRALPKPVFSYNNVLQVFNQAPIRTNKGIRDRAMMELFYATAIRRSELTHLNILDIDLHKQQARIDKGKGAKDRYVPFGNQAKYWLVKYLRDSRPVFADIGSGNAFFLSNRGRRFRPAYMSSLMSKYIRLANINKYGSCHQYRHAAATHMVDNDADIRHVQEYLGHASIATTQVYVHVSQTKLTKVYKSTHPRAE